MAKHMRADLNDTRETHITLIHSPSLSPKKKKLKVICGKKVVKNQRGRKRPLPIPSHPSLVKGDSTLTIKTPRTNL